MTNWRKVDAALAGALGRGGDDPLSVFVHYDPGETAELEAMGIDPGPGIATATLTAAEIGELSERPWVRQIRLSSPLRLRDDQ